MRGWAGKTTGSSSPAEPFDDAAEPRGADVRLAVDRRDDVGARARGRAARGRRALARDRREREARRPPSRRRPPRSGPARLRARASRASARPGRGAAPRPVDLDAVALLRHRQSPERMPASTWATGMPVACAARAPASVEFVSPKTSTQSGRSALDRASDPRPHRRDVARAQVEPVARLGEAELVEEDLRELAVVVLAGVDDDLLDPGVAERDRERRRLDELRPVADDGEHLHRGS